VTCGGGESERLGVENEWEKAQSEVLALFGLIIKGYRDYYR